MNGIQIAIDGPAASGKSTAARLLAQRLGGLYVNTGDMYRTLSRGILDAGVDPVAQPEKVAPLLETWDLRYRRMDDGSLQLFFNGKAVRQEDIRAPEVADVVSHVAKLPEVRQWMLERQRECKSLGTIVMEGRDIGTVILPDATFKFFLTASPEERARRRFLQKGEIPSQANLATVAAQIAERDRIDSSRAVAPLKPAPDARVISTDGMNQEQVLDCLLAIIQEAN
jgi:cytidylate kinase